jgi:hypothetical protein
MKSRSSRRQSRRLGSRTLTALRDRADRPEGWLRVSCCRMTRAQHSPSLCGAQVGVEHLGIKSKPGGPRRRGAGCGARWASAR